MQTIKRSQGFTLIELMITVGIVAVLAGIALPAYQGYIKTSAQTTSDANGRILAAFEDNYYYENGTYLAGTYGPGLADTLTVALGWKPSGDKDKYKYVVTAKAGAGNTIANSYTVTVTYASNSSITAVFTKP
jgi:type IV pilus assembly protein PilE